MQQAEEQSETSPGMEELKRAASRTSNWRERLKAVEALRELGGQPAVDLLTRIVSNDTVHQVQLAAHEALTELGVQAERPAKKTNELVKGTGKILLRIKKSLPAGHSYEAFKEKLKNMRTDVYDIYEGDKGEGFDEWLESTWSSLSGR
ncbi:HEAT repeat domain-containing protein [Paenibacillus sacheonensis]|uniref:HEAT repeat domain-containing protein n=1 Tax=Paenibacillus sacheonensis TaxID=742054 RepID=A0A7X4YTV5_9BACL|nr:HEAT repeat domain-containing protein [Paenibacillus sacheonensis]NBC72418.1 HEAT repeat domain-containing protein [Paenibacillus sacheonensis]